MTITLTEQFRADLGGRKWRAYQVTHDESTSTIAAISIDLNYIDFFTHSYTNLTSAPANTSITARVHHNVYKLNQRHVNNYSTS